jgi:hypothetical protein
VRTRRRERAPCQQLEALRKPNAEKERTRLEETFELAVIGRVSEVELHDSS